MVRYEEEKFKKKKPRKKETPYCCRVLYGIVMVILLGFAGYQLLKLADNKWDEKVCRDEFMWYAWFEPTYLAVYANDDFHTINFGKDIHCTVFWRESPGWMTSVEFELGTLTPPMIQDARYWWD